MTPFPYLHEKWVNQTALNWPSTKGSWIVVHANIIRINDFMCRLFGELPLILKSGEKNWIGLGSSNIWLNPIHSSHIKANPFYEWLSSGWIRLGPASCPSLSVIISSWAEKAPFAYIAPRLRIVFLEFTNCIETHAVSIQNVTLSSKDLRIIGPTRPKWHETKGCEG